MDEIWYYVLGLVIFEGYLLFVITKKSYLHDRNKYINESVKKIMSTNL